MTLTIGQVTPLVVMLGLVVVGIINTRQHVPTVSETSLTEGSLLMMEKSCYSDSNLNVPHMSFIRECRSPCSFFGVPLL